jgi:N-methylhydantoinase A/oxoprolinase/acetone carboxylase beta subunit
MIGYRIGIDVGGTNTDGVLMAGREVLAWAKRPTTRDVTAGIRAVLGDLLAARRVEAGAIGAVMLGTTHFTNAVVQRRGLTPTAVVRLCLPAGSAVPPLFDWPPELRAALGDHAFLVGGGHEFDGREISPLDEVALRRVAAELRARGVRAVAVVGIFAPVAPEHEERAAALLRAELPDAAVTVSHEIGRVSLLERENAAALNASLVEMARRTLRSFRAALAEQAIEAPLYVSQNDGTLMSADYAERYPVLTFSSGPTNSMRGAAFLSGLADALVVDVGGTTTDVGLLVGGFPREASFAVNVGQVRTNFRMPDLLSIGLGGGSLVRDGGARIGPDSVGFELTERALVFGGPELTASDVAVAAGLAEMGDPTRVSHLDRALVERALGTIKETVETAIDQMKTGPEPMPVILVGGGSVLLDEAIAGVSSVLRPEHYRVANAIGAAIAQVSGEVDQVYAMEGRTRESVLDEARAAARTRAIEAGADPATVEVVDIDEIPLTYLPSNALRVRVKVVGDLKLAAVSGQQSAIGPQPRSRVPNATGGGKELTADRC